MKYLPSGAALTTFNIADNQYKAGEQTTQWYRCTVFGNQAETANEYIRKGAQVMVVGTLFIDNYTANDGSERTSFNVNVTRFQMAGRRGENGDNGGNGYQNNGRAPAAGNGRPQQQQRAPQPRQQQYQQRPPQPRQQQQAPQPRQTMARRPQPQQYQEPVSEPDGNDDDFSDGFEVPF
jgi:single-strand DNA-binding protein